MDDTQPVNWGAYRRGDLLLIDWDDAHAVTDAWTHDSELNDLDTRCVVQTVGFFVSVVERQLVICADLTAGGDGLLLNTVSAIPTGCVHRITLLGSSSVGRE